MRYFLLLSLLVFTGSQEAVAQSSQLEMGSQRASTQISTVPVVQWYTHEDQTLLESSFPVSVFIPLGRQVVVTAQSSAAMVGGNDVSSLRGLNDLHTSLSYSEEVGNGTFIFTTGVNIASGKQKLTREEFETSLLISRNFYNFQVSSLGQGFNASSGGTWAYPVNDNLVVGLGGSYLYKGGYQPLRERAQTYRPGNEVLFTAGLDYGLNETSSIAADFTYVRYGQDRWATQRFKAGVATVVMVQFLKYIRFDELRIAARYRNRAKSELPLRLEGETVQQQVRPNQAEVLASYEMRVNEAVSLGSRTRMRIYGETIGYSSKYLLDVGVHPQLQVSESLTVASRVIGTLGSFFGIEVGLGAVVEL